jgi:hypothetical protein
LYKCPAPAGNFLRDIDDQTSISSKDIAISLSGVPDGLGCWACPECGEEVAQRFSGDHWRVRTKRGWIQ